MDVDKIDKLHTFDILDKIDIPHMFDSLDTKVLDNLGLDTLGIFHMFGSFDSHRLIHSIGKFDIA